MECPICYEDMNRHTTLACGHTFHKDCIDKWAERQNTCPYCRFIFKPTSDLELFLMLFTIVAYTCLFLGVAFSR